MLKILLMVCIVVVLLPVTWTILSFFYPDLLLRSEPNGLCEGQLSARPNWVSSKVPKSDPHYIAPLPKVDKKVLIECIKHLPPKKISIEMEGDHIHGVRRTAFWGFADWFCIEPTGDITSSATLGHSDLGVNRHWVEALRACLIHPNRSH